MALKLPSTPDNYDNVYIAVTPINLNDAVTAISAAVTDIGNYLNDIYDCLNGLNLSWVGQSSASADELNNLWQSIVVTLFGTGTSGVVNTSPGALNTMLQAVGQVASNYAGTEQAIAGMFNAMYNQLSGSSTPTGLPRVVTTTSTSGGYTPVTQDASDAPYYSTAVDEI